MGQVFITNTLHTQIYIVVAIVCHLENRCGKARLRLHKSRSRSMSPSLEDLYPSLRGTTPILMKWQHKSLPSRLSGLGDARETGRVEGRTEWITLFFPSSCKINKNALFVFGFYKISVQRIFRTTIALGKQSVRVTLPSILLLCLAAKKWWSICDCLLHLCLPG